MASKQFQNILHHVPNLDYSQLKKLRHQVELNISNNQVGQAIAEHEEMISYCLYWAVLQFGVGELYLMY